MRYILSSTSRPVLKRLAAARTLCAFDFDGTLAPIVRHPSMAAMRARTLALLDRLAEVYPCIVVSGRSRSDLMGKLGEAKVAHVIGNHGREMETATRSTRPPTAAWKTALEFELGSEGGLWVEDKGLSVAVHYRQFPRKAEARHRILMAAQKLEGVQIFGGKQVVNLVEVDAPTKRTALAAERDRLQCEWVLYVGDDENDEDAFAMDGKTVPVRVGKSKRSHAHYYLRAQSEIDKLLGLLVQLRPSHSPGSSGRRDLTIAEI